MSISAAEKRRGVNKALHRIEYGYLPWVRLKPDLACAALIALEVLMKRAKYLGA